MEESLNFLQNMNPRKEGNTSERKNPKNPERKGTTPQKSQSSTTKPAKVLVEDSTFDVMDYQGKITDDDIKNAGTLQLEEVMGNLLSNNKLKINAAGLVNGLRKCRDGVAFFGKVKKYNNRIWIL